MKDHGDCTATVRVEVDGDTKHLYRCDKPIGHEDAHHDNFAAFTWSAPWIPSAATNLSSTP